MKKLVFISLAIILAISLVFVGCTKQTPTPTPAPAPSPATQAAPTPAPTPTATGLITIKAVSFVPKDAAQAVGANMIVDRINKVAPNRLKIDWIGGPEVVAAYDLPDAVKRGVVEMNLICPGGYFVGIAPEAYATDWSYLNAWDERRNGTFEMIDGFLQKEANQKFLGRVDPGMKLGIWTKKEITKPEDLAGLKIRFAASYLSVADALGIKAVTMNPPDVYTGLERNTIDGVEWAALGLASFGWQEQVGYQIMPQFGGGGCFCTVNLDVWNKLPKDVQDILIRELEIWEGIGNTVTLQQIDKEWIVIQKAGVKRVDFQGADAEKYLSTVYGALWGDVAQKVPDKAAALKQALTQGLAVPLH